MEEAFPRKIKVGLSLLLIIAGVGFYWAWGIMYNSWDILNPKHMGVYAITVTCVVFGILGLLLTRAQK